MTHQPKFIESCPVAKIKPGKNVRADLGNLGDMVESVKAHGILQPPSIMEDFTTICGHRRIEAARRAGLEEIAVLMYPMLTDLEIKLIQLPENIQRKEMSDLDIFNAISELEEGGMKRFEIAKVVSVSDGTISNWLSPKVALPEVLERFLAGKLTLDQVAIINRSDDPLLTLGLMIDGVPAKKARKKARKPDANAVRTSSIKCCLPSGHTISIKGKDFSLDEALDILADASKSIRDGIKLNYTAKTFKGAVASAS